MSDPDEEIWSRITRCLAGQPEPGDVEAMNRWAEASPKNRDAVEQLRQSWLHAEAMDRERSLEPGPRVRGPSPTFLIRVVTMAALFLVFALMWKWVLKRP
jgi:ferric-dicitrate binding protein FerR (iron transport regulator)